MLEMSVEPFMRTTSHHPAAATQATCSSATPSLAKAMVVVRTISAGVVAGAAAENLRLVLRDGASGSGAIVWSVPVGAAANGANVVALSDLNIPMTPGNVATLEFTGAGGAGSQEGVSLGYHITNEMGDARALGTY